MSKESKRTWNKAEKELKQMKVRNQNSLIMLDAAKERIRYGQFEIKRLNDKYNDICIAVAERHLYGDD